MTDCPAPALVETIQVDPDAAGPLPDAVYTHLRYDVGTLTATEIRAIRFVAAIPLRENTLDWNGAAAGAGSAPAGADQGANLDNNSGPETSDEQSLPVYSRAAGDYDGTLAVSDTDTITRTAEDLRILKSASSDVISQGAITTWTLHVDASEYRYVDGVTVADTLPDGLCPLDTATYENSGECDGRPVARAFARLRDRADRERERLLEPRLGRCPAVWSAPRATRSRSRAGRAPTTRRTAPTRRRSSAATHGQPGLDHRRRLTGICAGGDDDCSGPGVKIDGDEVDGTPDADVSSAGQTAGGPAIDKRVQDTTAARVDCTTGGYSDTPPGAFAPGDKVCYRLRATFPSDLDFRNTQVTDFVPVGHDLHPGSAELTPASTVAATIDESDAPAITFDLAAGDVDAIPGQVFEAVLAVRVDQATTVRSGDITANLMKLSYANTAGTTFPLRDELDTTVTAPSISLLTGVRTVNGDTARNANVDAVTVPGKAAVQYRVDVTNSGTLAAQDVEVWAKLPSGTGRPTCADVSGISDGGACLGVVGDQYIRWVVPALAASGARSLTYTTQLGENLTGAQSLVTAAGVREFTSQSNDGTVTWTPASNIDTANPATPNTAAANDPTNILLRNFSVTGAITSAVSETGNNAVSGTTAQATIGERVTFTGTLQVPEGTTFSDAVFRYAVSSRLTGVANVAATLNGGALPVGWTVAYSGGYVTLTGPGTPYLNDDDGDGTHTEDDAFVVTFDAIVDQAAANTRLAGNIAAVWNLASYEDVDGAVVTTGPSSASLAVQIVEPVITTTITAPANNATVHPGDDIAYTVRTANGNATRTSIAHETFTTVTVPIGLTPYVSGGPVADGGAIAGGTWNATARTITFNEGDINPNANATHTFTLRVDVPAVAGNLLRVDAVGTTTSHPGVPAPALERTATTTPSTGYRSAAAVDVELVGLGITKTADRSTATIGEQALYTLDVTLRRDLTYYDVTVRDQLPANLVHDGMVDAVCLSGCGAPGDLGATVLPQAGQTTGYFIGDVAQSNADRVVRIRYRAHVGGGAAEGATLQNSASVHDNATNVITGVPGAIPAAASFSQTAGPATHTITVHEPESTITKAVTGTVSATRITPGDTATYTLVVRNTGQSALHDVHVTDVPDTDLAAVTPTTNAGLLTGSWTAAGDTLAWDIPGPIAPNDTVTLAYTARLAASAGIAQSAAVDNTARITAAYGLSAAVRGANPGFTYRTYAPRQSSANLTAALPRVGIVQTTGAAGNPESAPAEVLQPFTWRVVVTNTGTLAVAHDLDVTDVLPADWTYLDGSAELDGVAIGDPAISGQSLTWDDLVASLAPGASRVLTFQATPQTAARTNPNPHVAQASVNWEDVTGATADAGGAYHAGDDPAQGVLAVPVLTVTKTPDAATADAGTDQPYTIVVENTGTVRARHVAIADTLPAGVAYTAGTATSGGTDAGFAETDGTGPDLAWAIDGLDAGQQLTITLPVRLDASLDAGTALVNTAGATSDERPDPATDTGTITTATHVDLGLLKTGPATAKAGEVVTWTLETVNNGPSDARDVEITDTLPAEVTFVDADAGCTHAAGVVTCAIGTLTPGQDATRTVRTRIDPGALAVAIVNDAHVEGSVTETDPANNDASATIATGNAVDLELTKTTTTPTVAQTLNATWKLHVVNQGPSDAYDVTLVDTLPAGVTYVSATPDQGTCAVAGQVITCDLGRINELQDADVTVVATGDAVGTQVNEAEVSTLLNTEIDPADNTASSPVVVTPVTDLSVVKTGPAEVPAGGTATYALTARNDGPSPATGVELVDELPAGLTFASASDGCSASGQTVICAVGDLAVGATAERTVTVKVATDLGSATVQNVARVRGAETDLDLSDNTALADTKVGPASDLRIAKRSTRLYATGEVTYILDVFNDGPSGAAGVTVRDAVPASLTVSRASSTQGTCASSGQDVRCDLGDMATGGAAAIQIVAVANGLPAGATIENVARVSGDVLDPNPDNDVAKVSGVVDGAAAPRYDLALTKTASSAKPLVGETFTYRIAVHNNGPDAAQNVTLTDPVPAGLEIGRITPERGECAVEGHLVRCALGTLKRGGRTAVTIVATALATGEFTNSALVAADGTDVKARNNGDVAGVHAVSARGGRITVEKTAAKRRVAGGGIVRYAIKVRARNGAASNVRVCDRLPDGMVFDRARGARFSAGHACWSIQLLRKGAVKKFRLTARAEVDARGRLVNRAMATAQGAHAARDRATVRARPNRGTRGGGVTG